MSGAPLGPRDLDQVHRIVAATCFHSDPTSSTRCGIELESFPVHVAGDGTPARRVPIAELRRLIDPLPLAIRPADGPDAAWRLDGGARLSFEPGGQLEHSSAPHAHPAGALAEVDAVAGAVAAALAGHGIVLAAAGIDLWTAGAGQQLRAPRYPAMAAFLAARGPAGAVMMRDTCAMQVNLDLGRAGGELAERWLVANLVAPVACATFAASPGGPGVASARALAWQRLDPTRTGFPAGLLDGSLDDPVAQVAAAALAADVLLLRGPHGWRPGRPGWTFADWLRDGHPDYGRPSPDDLRYHLTTLFIEVRPRGFLELRSLDALPARLRAVPVVLLAGLLDDARARAQVRAVLEPHRARLPDLWRRAATAAVADPELCALAVETWSFALEGAARLPAGHLPAGALTRAERFLERCTMRGRCPADELRAALTDGPAAALAWAAEPVPEEALPKAPGAGERV